MNVFSTDFEASYLWLVWKMWREYNVIEIVPTLVSLHEKKREKKKKREYNCNYYLKQPNTFKIAPVVNKEWCFYNVIEPEVSEYNSKYIL